MSNSCTQPFSIQVVSQTCSTLVLADWLTNPGSCRLRVKNFNAADWLAGGCGGCANAGGKTWDGTFPLFSHFGAEIAYQIDPTVGNIGGKLPFFGQNSSVGTFTGSWFMALACNPNYIWASGFRAFPALPTGIYARAQGCVLGATFEIEAY